MKQSMSTTTDIEGEKKEREEREERERVKIALGVFHQCSPCPAAPVSATFNNNPILLQS